MNTNYGHFKIMVIAECYDFFGFADFLCLVTCQLPGETQCKLCYCENGND